MKKYYKIYLDNDTNGMLLNILEAKNLMILMLNL